MLHIILALNERLVVWYFPDYADIARKCFPYMSYWAGMRTAKRCLFELVDEKRLILCHMIGIPKHIGQYYKVAGRIGHVDRQAQTNQIWAIRKRAIKKIRFARSKGKVLGVVTPEDIEKEPSPEKEQARAEAKKVYAKAYKLRAKSRRIVKQQV